MIQNERRIYSYSVLPEQASNYPGQPSMSLSTIRKGIELAVEVTTTVEVDIVEVGGTTH